MNDEQRAAENRSGAGVLGSLVMGELRPCLYVSRNRVSVSECVCVCFSFYKSSKNHTNLFSSILNFANHCQERRFTPRTGTGSAHRRGTEFIARSARNITEAQQVVPKQTQQKKNKTES